MLRLLAVALLAANLLYFGWTMGWLDSVVGIHAAGDREPERMARQVRPDEVILTPAASASAAPAAAATPSGTTIAAVETAASKPELATPINGSAANAGPASAASATTARAIPGVCLEAGPFAASELPAAEKTLQTAWPGGAWTKRKIDGSGEWMIYMGPYPDNDWLERKKSELSRIRGGLPYEVLNAPPPLARGISLGRFGSQAAAEQRLEQLGQRGIRTARVVRSGSGAERTLLRVANADAAIAARLATVNWPSGQAGFTSCSKSP